MNKFAITIALITPLLCFSKHSLADTFYFEKVSIDRIEMKEIMRNIYKMKADQYANTDKLNQIMIKNTPKVMLTMRPITEYENIQGKTRYEVIIDIDEIVNGIPKKYEQCKKNVDVFTFDHDIEPNKYTLVGMSLQGSVCTYDD
ncbi:hypothetical protein ACDX34_03660 [Acinetobacter bereziniae]|uniref:hypothetical protein n=1 Tax=Acinetobacter bereziniae TaxID=106648 RepID=UPI0019028A18|nr:hypothetical protein [Acinetobacter bereziniae]MBJ8450623.1 hypothetical protein [Acinetobacter bereziniae]MBJ8455435.1 hypothetical protein [Acinetobacter bereziniae]